MKPVARVALKLEAIITGSVIFCPRRMNLPEHQSSAPELRVESKGNVAREVDGHRAVHREVKPKAKLDVLRHTSLALDVRAQSAALGGDGPADAKLDAAEDDGAVVRAQRACEQARGEVDRVARVGD